MKKFQYILIGYGNMGKQWYSMLKKRDDVCIVGVIDVLEVNRKQALTDCYLPENRISDNLLYLIENTRPDFIIDSSPPHVHASNTQLALHNNCHVLGEKPIALSLHQAREVVDLAKKKKRIYMINQNYRWHPVFVEIRKYLKRNPLGEIKKINIYYAQNLLFNDTFRYTMNHPLLLDMAIHHFDMVRSITDSSTLKVYCDEYNLKNSPFKNGSSAIAVIKMNNNVVINYQGSWSDTGIDTSFNGIWQITGDKGTLHWDGDNVIEMCLMKNNKIQKKKLSFPSLSKKVDKNIFFYELASSFNAFLHAIKTNTLPETDSSDNVKTLQIVLGAIESAEKGTVIATG
jgi:predicted dehydrogenase